MNHTIYYLIYHTFWLGFDQWKLLPLGRGFFEISFASADDKRKAWSTGTYFEARFIAFVKMGALFQYSYSEAWKTPIVFNIGVKIG
jgi:hypothetical protein